MNLKRTIEDGKWFNLGIQALVVVSLVVFSVETLPHLGRPTRHWLRILEIVTVAVFTIEYALRIVVADDRVKFITSFYGLIDLIAILPFYVATGIDLRTIRLLRIFRVFRIFKLLRYTKALDRFKDAFRELREELVLFAIATGFMIFFSSVGIYYFEGETQPAKFGSVFHCMWWAVITLTTVGYGDVYPVTIGGRMFTAVVLFIGIGLVAVPTGLFASALTRTRKKDWKPDDGIRIDSAHATPGASMQHEHRSASVWEP